MQSDSVAGETLYITTKTQGEPASLGWVGAGGGGGGGEGGEFVERLFVAASNYRSLLAR